MRRIESTILVIISALLVVVAAGFIAGSKGQQPVYHTIPSEHTGSFQFEVVSSITLKEKGLGGRTDIPHDYGMLFVFPKDGNYGFWMRDMLVPIDIIWLSDKGEIVGIDDAVPTNSYPHVFYPPQPIRYVLETRANEASAQGWRVGTILPIPLQD